MKLYKRLGQYQIIYLFDERKSTKKLIGCIENSLTPTWRIFVPYNVICLSSIAEISLRYFDATEYSWKQRYFFIV